MTTSVPILFLVFNRPETTNIVFEAIREAKPKKLYVAADGPRSDRPSDFNACNAVRKIISQVDWDCEVQTLFREENHGCKYAVSSAINWFFESEEMGIILEDDVVPNSDFFKFCEVMLKRYQNDTRVGMITGTNYYSDVLNTNPFFFSRHYTIWGWATWRRSWSTYDVEMDLWRTSKKIKDDIRYLVGNNKIYKHYAYTFDLLEDTFCDTWDIQWVFKCLVDSQYCITPSVNLITNIGVTGSHSREATDSHFLETFPLSKSYESFDPNIIPNSSYDNLLHYNKSYPALRRVYVIKLLKRFGAYRLVKYLYKKIHCG